MPHVLTRHSIAPLFAGALLICFTGAAFAAGTPKTNVIILLADDLGHADIGCQAVEKDVVTPNIDSIAANGTRFTTAYVSCPVCSPSAPASSPANTRNATDTRPTPSARQEKIFGLPLTQVTLADEFHRIGYATAAFGKWHEGDQPQFWPLKRGFDEFFGFLGGMHSYFVRPNSNTIRRNNDPVEETPVSHRRHHPRSRRLHRSP